MAARNRMELLVGAIIFVPTITMKWMLATVLSAETQLLSYCVLQIIFLCYIMRMVYQSLLSACSVSQEVIYASIVLYLLFSICLTLIYYAILFLEP